MSDIYISYIRDQKPQARRLALALREIGWSCWFEQVLSGKDLSVESKDEARKYAKCVIALFSEGIEDEVRTGELAEAKAKSNLICVTFDKSTPSEFQTNKVHSLYDWTEDGDKSFQILIREVEEIAGLPSKPLNWKKVFSILSIVLMVAGLVWAFLMFKDQNKRLLQDSRDWRAVKSDLSYETVNAYLKAYPKGKNIGRATMLRDSLLDVRVWDTTRYTTDIVSLEKYLDQFPDAVKRDSAEMKLYSLKESKAWSKAINENTLVSYSVYLELFEDGMHIDEANQRIEQIQNPVKRKIFVARKPKLLKTYKTPKDVICLAASADGAIIVTRGWNETAWVWDVKGDLISELKGHTDWLSCVAISPDGKRIVTGSWDHTIKLWDQFGNLLKSFKAHEEHISAVTFSKDGSHILTGSFDNTAKLFDLKGNLLQTFIGHTKGVTSVSYSPKGNRVATASIDKTVRIWDLTGYEIRSFDDHVNRVNCVAFSPNGKLIVSASADRMIRVCRLVDGKSIKIRGHKASVNSVMYSFDGTKILSGSSDMTAIEWSATGDKITTYPLSNSEVNTIAYLGRTSQVLLGGKQGAYLFEPK